MFSVGELAKRFGVSRQTIYNKFSTEELKQYVIDENGAKLVATGLDILTRLLADGKAGQQVTKKIEQHRQDEVDTKESYFDKYVKSLESQIEELKREKAALQAKYDFIVERLFSFEQKLLESKEHKTIWQKLRIKK